MAVDEHSQDTPAEPPLPPPASPGPQPRRTSLRALLRTRPLPRPRWRTAHWWVLGLAAAVHTYWLLTLVALRFIDPFTTGVQLERRVESWFSPAWLRGASYQKRSEFVPLSRLPAHVAHAVIAAEDGRFYLHHGIDWEEIEEVIEDAGEKGRITRGASTITQQLVKNLYFTTHGNPVRKLAEFTLAPMADLVLGKRRVLELYLNVAEWGPGVFGIEAAARHHYGVSAVRLDRDQAARLAACLPSPLRRRPARMTSYAAIIQERMRLMGW